MAKYTHHLKMKTIDLVLNHQYSARNAASELNIPRSLVSFWLALFDKHGESGLSRTYGSYSSDFKVEVVEYMQAHHLSYFSTAVHFAIPSQSIIKNWEQIYSEYGRGALYLDFQERMQMTREPRIRNVKQKTTGTHEELIAEVEHLRMEVAYLKKLSALVQQKKQSTTKTK